MIKYAQGIYKIARLWFVCLLFSFIFNLTPTKSVPAASNFLDIFLKVK